MSFSLIQADDEETRPKRTRSVPFAATVRYWFGLDSHVYAMAIAANVLFGFFPFMLLLLSLAAVVAPQSNADHAVLLGLRAFLPEDPGLVDFVVRNLQAAVASRGTVQAVSVVLLLLAANGIFMPLEVAQNRLWGFPRNRNYFKNQLLSLGITATSMAVALGAALFGTVAGPAVHRSAWSLFLTPDGTVLACLKMAEAAGLVLLLYLVYWALPNGPTPRRRALAVAVAVAALIEAGQAAYSWVWPWLDLRSEYGPFFISVTLLLWGFLSAMVVLAGAESCARPASSRSDAAAA